MVRVALIVALLAGLVLNAAPIVARAQEATPAAGLGVPATIYNTNLQPIGEVSVTEIVDPFADYDLANGQPARGFRWVMAIVRLKAGEQALNTSSSGFFQVVDDEGFVANQTYITRTQESLTAYPDYIASAIEPGQEATGAVFFQVFGDAEIATIEYSPDYSQFIVAADLRESPVAAGATVPVTANDGSVLGDLSVLGVLDPLEDYDPSYAPQRGFRYVGIAVSFTNTSPRNFMLDVSRFSVSDQEGFGYTTYGVYRTPEGEAAFPSLSYADVAPGATLTGMVTIEMINGAAIRDVRFSPPGDRRIRLAEFGPDDVLTPPTMNAVPTPTPEPTADPACADAATWGAAVESQLPSTTAAFDVITKATSGEQVDVQQIRDAADQIRIAADSLDDLDTPEIAAAASEQLVGILSDVATQVDVIADAIDAGDTTAIQPASDEIGRLLFEELVGGAFGELIARCPVLNE